MTNRHCLDWSEPCLPVAARWIISNLNASPDTCDLSDITCLTPGRRAGRLLLDLLARYCGETGLFLLPPRCLTPGALMEALTPAEAPCATDAERLGAWFGAIRRCPAETIKPLLPFPPEDDDTLAWHSLARTIMGLHDELAGQRLVFNDVAQKAERTETLYAEAQRWHALDALYISYLECIEAGGLVDPHVFREQVMTRGVESDPPIRAVVMIGVIDLNAVQRAMLHAHADHLEVLIHAPPSLIDHFDDLGCVLESPWTAMPIDIDDAQIQIVDRPADAAQQTLRCIDGYQGRYAAPDITIGLGDETLIPQLQRAAQWAGLGLHAASGIELSRTPPARLLQAVADWLREPRFENFARLVRHPDLERWLELHLTERGLARRGVAQWLTLLDTYFNEHLQASLTGEWLGDADTRRELEAVHRAVGDWLSPLAGNIRVRSEWSEPILAVIRRIYQAYEKDAHDDPDAVTFDACLHLLGMLDQPRYIAPELQFETTAEQAIELLLADAADAHLAQDVEADQIEMLGWLELHLDPAPALIITGVNDGMIPHAVMSDAFLPDSLRRQLGLMHNQRRYARDAYLMQAIVNSREQLTLIAGRRSSEGDPLTPSRLLMACVGDTLRDRVTRICADDEERVAPLPIGLPVPTSNSSFVVPKLPADLQPPAVMNVTDFRSYLQCPYRYALNRLLKLTSMGKVEAELDPLRFGALAHDVLEAFGRNESIRDCVEPDTIRDFLFDELRVQGRAKFGNSPLPSVRVQLARLERRLIGFAQLQSELRIEGWVIRHCELKFTDQNLLDIPDDEPMRIVGKIDRIDLHESDGRWRILDYKTGDAQSSPHKAHVGVERIKDGDDLEWADLQLPLYRHLAQQHDIAGDVELGYLVLPKQADGVKLMMAEWSPEQIDSALECARQVVRDIRTGRFEMNADLDSSYDAFSRICQTEAFSPATAAAFGEGEDE